MVFSGDCWFGSDAYCTLSVNNTSGALYWSDLKITATNTPKSIDNTSDHTAANRPLIKSANSITDYALSGGTDGIYFDGTNDLIEIPYHKDLTDFNTSDFTFETWYNLGDTNDNPIFGRDGAGTSDTSTQVTLFTEPGSNRWRIRYNSDVSGRSLCTYNVHFSGSKPQARYSATIW